MEIIRCGSITKAAETLHISQPALSAQIRSLEQELGCSLFLRTPKGISLTEAGRAFSQRAEGVLSEWDRLQEELAAFSRTANRHVHIGLGVRALSNGLLWPVTEFFGKNNELSVSITTTLNTDILAALDGNSLDIAISRLPPAFMIHNRSRYSIRPLLRERQCMLMAREAPERRLEQIAFTALDGRSAVCGPEGSIDDIVMKRLCEEREITLARIYRSDSIDTVMAMVRAGKGWALGPESFASYFNITAVPIVPETQIELNFISRYEDRENRMYCELEQYLRHFLLETQKKSCQSSPQPAAGQES